VAIIAILAGGWLRNHDREQAGDRSNAGGFRRPSASGYEDFHRASWKLAL